MKSKIKNNVVALIPAYNEEFSIADVVKKVKAHAFIKECIVVDDGSLDKTGEVARKAGAKILRPKMNVGTGKATHLGLQEVIKHDTERVILLDADGQHDPVYLPKLIQALDGETDLVIGSRYLTGKSKSTSFLRKIGTKIISIVIFLKYGQRIYDPTSGFRVLTKKALKQFTEQYPYTFSEPEVVIEAIKNGMKIKEVPIDMKPRIYGTSTIKITKAFQLMFYILRRIITDSSR